MSISKKHSSSLDELQRPLSHLPVGSLRLPLSLLFAIGMLPKKGQGMPFRYLCYVSTFGYRYVAFNFYWFYQCIKELSCKDKHFFNTKNKKYIVFDTLQILHHTMFLVMF
jgi:hypothetical protein